MDKHDNNEELINDYNAITSPINNDLTVGDGQPKEIIRFCNIMKYPKMGGILSINRYNRGAKPHSDIDSRVFAVSYYRILNESVSKKYLDSVFVGFTGKHTRIAFKILQALNSHPNSSITYISELTNIHHTSLKGVLKALIDYGMIVIDGKWRLVWVFGAYKKDVVYSCSKKGKEALKRIYMDNGLLN